MVSIEYNPLKVEQEFIYFTKSLKQFYNWHIELQAESIKLAFMTLLIKGIEDELEIS